MTRSTLDTRGQFSLAASTRFIEGFAPSAARPADRGHLHLAFVPDGDDRAGGACITQAAADGPVTVETFGAANADRMVAAVERILSLDIDGRAFPDVGRHDAVIGRLLARFGGLRPVLFNSPFEAAAWTIIGQRIRIVQAARVKARIADELGEGVDIHGDTRRAFPAAGRIARLASFPGLTDRKLGWLRSLGATAANGERLHAGRLRAMAVDDALADLMRLPGIGPFSAELVLLRGAGEPDRLPNAERRLLRAAAGVYGRDELSIAELTAIAEGWRPYRTWVAVLLRTALEDATGEIGGRRTS